MSPRKVNRMLCRRGLKECLLEFAVEFAQGILCFGLSCASIDARLLTLHIEKDQSVAGNAILFRLDRADIFIKPEEFNFWF